MGRPIHIRIGSVPVGVEEVRERPLDKTVVYSPKAIGVLDLEALPY